LRRELRGRGMRGEGASKRSLGEGAVGCQAGGGPNERQLSAPITRLVGSRMTSIGRVAAPSCEGLTARRKRRIHRAHSSCLAAGHGGAICVICKQVRCDAAGTTRTGRVNHCDHFRGDTHAVNRERAVNPEVPGDGLGGQIEGQGSTRTIGKNCIAADSHLLPTAAGTLHVGCSCDT